ncbi:vitellogenin-1-like [Phlebotomus argentipes]|uniref:vitellogenin-1-like n=1 Tax=Phlebotomus argentipes TaxID=94469 RepID=UPI002892C03C|nr:vitellogenin-1-like [Phlebotomus argentipes]
MKFGILSDTPGKFSDNMPRPRSRSRSYSRSVSHSHREKKYSRSHKSSRYKSSRKSREKDRHSSSSRKHSSKHHRSDRSHRRHSSSRSRSSSQSSRHSSTSTSSVPSEKSKESPVAEKTPSFASVEQLGSNVSAKVFQELNEDTFAVKSFTPSAKSTNSSILIDITSNPKVKLQSTPDIPEEDTVFHQNLYGNDAARMDKWVKKLFAYRQRCAATGKPSS